MGNGELVTTERRELTLGGTENPGIYAAAIRAAKEVEVAYLIALQRPRNIQQTRQDLLDACRRPSFAEQSEYAKPVGGGKIAKSPSIRFAEEAIRAYKHIQTIKSTIYEDLAVRKIQVRVIDLENNIAYEDECTLQKTVERKVIEGREIIAERKNSKGEKIYIVCATEDEMLTKTNAQVSKMIRVLSLRLIPSDIVEEAMIVAKQTLKQVDAADPKQATKKIFDSFNKIGITPEMLVGYMGSNKPIFTEDEVQDLRAIFTAIQNKETTWKEVVSQDEEKIKPKQKKSLLEQMAGNNGDGQRPQELTDKQKEVMEIPADILSHSQQELNLDIPIFQYTDEICEEIKRRANLIADNK